MGCSEKKLFFVSALIIADFSAINLDNSEKNKHYLTKNVLRTSPEDVNYSFKAGQGGFFYAEPIETASAMAEF